MKTVKLISCIIILLSVISCKTEEPLITGSNELTPSEYQQLLKKARIFIAVAPRLKLTPISREDKRFINTHEPKFHADYYGHKSGQFTMIWAINPSYHVRVIGKGKFLDPSCKFRLTVSRFAQ